MFTKWQPGIVQQMYYLPKTVTFTEWPPATSRTTGSKHKCIYQMTARNVEVKTALLNTILLTEWIPRTYRTVERKHKYIHQMTARKRTTEHNFIHGSLICLSSVGPSLDKCSGGGSYLWYRHFSGFYDRPSKEICQSVENHSEHAQNINNTREWPRDWCHFCSGFLSILWFLIAL